jgi:hypothetical protein
MGGDGKSSSWSSKQESEEYPVVDNKHLLSHKPSNTVTFEMEGRTQPVFCHGK